MQAGGVLGRLAQLLAQWLRGLARRLDRAAGGAAVPQPVLAALAERFPGAPEHWLADIARHMIAAGEPLPGIDIEMPPMDAPPVRETRSPTPTLATAPAPARRSEPSPRTAARKARPALRLIGGETRRQPVSETASPGRKRHTAQLHWLAASPKTVAEPSYPDTPPLRRAQTEFTGDSRQPPPSSPDIPFAFRKAERLTNLTTAPDRIGKEAPAPTATHRSARQTFQASSEGQSRGQELAFTALAPPADTERSADPVFADSIRIPVEFAPLRPAQRVSLSFPQAHSPHRASEWAGAPATSWPALPTPEQSIDDAPSPASPLTDLVREQMAGRWSA